MAQTHLAVDALVYDAYGTLFDVYSVFEKCEKNFPGKGAAISEIWRAKQLEYTWLRSLMGKYQNFWELTEAGLRFACKALELNLTDEILRELMDNYLNLATYEEVPGTLKKLSATIQQAVLSNGNPEMLNTVVENNNLNSYLQAVLSVDGLSIYKPTPKVYQLAVDKLGVPSNKIGFVSSNCWDAIGAKSFGFRVFWINRFKRPLDELGIVPDHEIQTLDQIEGLLS
ncbi:MAG: haloacid dehalogenase type II [SAR324 cluster bacterium]|nr:haloacid dehalogenase type II [SAR324 cluster bacterium]MCZ6557519.1 haloacid dehalogenase type II [SAR324 cluster bacterium]